MKKGEKMTQAQKDKIQSALLGKKYPNRNLPASFTAEHKRKISESKKGLRPSSETRKKMSISHTGKSVSPETIEKWKLYQLNKRLERLKKLLES